MFQNKKAKDDVLNIDENSQNILSIIKDTSKATEGIFVYTYTEHTDFKLFTWYGDFTRVFNNRQWPAKFSAYIDVILLCTFHCYQNEFYQPF